ncbi:hypothetical protein SEA_ALUMINUMJESUS_9 [Microbacterium phage AluminumJesus]|nr:hypothetical protein SEA_ALUMINUMJESUS_9 [Microbacterium phage AluminumJesus]
MNDNEKLIEEAAEAMRRAHAENGFVTLFTDWARVALAVFEKAHTPPDAEREALASFVTNRLADNGYAVPRPEVWLALSNWEALNAPLRRSEVPEQSAETVHRGTFGHVWPCPLFYVGNWRRVDSGHEPVRECTNTAACGSPEQQDEPSDAQVNLAVEALAAAWTPEDPRTAVRAALRAAGGVR